MLICKVDWTGHVVVGSLVTGERVMMSLSSVSVRAPPLCFQVMELRQGLNPEMDACRKIFSPTFATTDACPSSISTEGAILYNNAQNKCTS